MPVRVGVGGRAGILMRRRIGMRGRARRAERDARATRGRRRKWHSSGKAKSCTLRSSNIRGGIRVARGGDNGGVNKKNRERKKERKKERAKERDRERDRDRRTFSTRPSTTVTLGPRLGRQSTPDPWRAAAHCPASQLVPAAAAAVPETPARVQIGHGRAQEDRAGPASVVEAAR